MLRSNVLIFNLIQKLYHKIYFHTWATNPILIFKMFRIWIQINWKHEIWKVLLSLFSGKEIQHKLWLNFNNRYTQLERLFCHLKNVEKSRQKRQPFCFVLRTILDPFENVGKLEHISGPYESKGSRILQHRF